MALTEAGSTTKRQNLLAPRGGTNQGNVHGRPITDVEIEYGPPELFGRFFLKADEAARARGVHLSYGTFEELAAVNRANPQSWRKLVTMYDPEFCSMPPDRAVCILGRNGAGEVVATQASRLYPLTNGSLYDELTSLRAYYDHPARDCQPGEECRVEGAAAETTKQIDGRVVVSGATWYRPDYRGLFLSAILTRLSRAYAFTRWSSDISSSIVHSGLVKGGVVARAGYVNYVSGIEIRNAPFGHASGTYAWMDRDFMLADLEQFLTRFDAEAEIDTPVAQRRA